MVRAARELADAHGLPLDAVRIGHIDGDLFDPRCTWLRRRGIGPEGAILVRPDRFVGVAQPRRGDGPAERTGLRATRSSPLCHGRAAPPVPPQAQPHEPERVDVAIVGYGPVGQALALALGRAGHRVAVVERFGEIYRMPRAVHIDHEIMRLLQDLGLAAEPRRRDGAAQRVPLVRRRRGAADDAEARRPPRPRAGSPTICSSSRRSRRRSTGPVAASRRSRCNAAGPPRSWRAPATARGSRSVVSGGGAAGRGPRDRGPLGGRRRRRQLIRARERSESRGRDLGFQEQLVRRGRRSRTGHGFASRHGCRPPASGATRAADHTRAQSGARPPPLGVHAAPRRAAPSDFDGGLARLGRCSRRGSARTDARLLSVRPSTSSARCSPSGCASGRALLVRRRRAPDTAVPGSGPLLRACATRRTSPGSSTWCYGASRRPRLYSTRSSWSASRRTSGSSRSPSSSGRSSASSTRRPRPSATRRCARPRSRRRRARAARRGRAEGFRRRRSPAALAGTCRCRRGWRAAAAGDCSTTSRVRLHIALRRRRPAEAGLGDSHRYLLAELGCNVASLQQDAPHGLRDLDGRAIGWLDGAGGHGVLVRPDLYVFGAAGDQAGVAALIDELCARLGMRH